MTLFQAFLCGVIYWIGNNSFARGYFVFSKPLVAGFLVGLVFGKPLEGAMIGAQINMIYLGWIGAGGASPADPCAAGVLSTAFVLATGLDMDAALVLAVPVGLVAIALYTMLMTVLAACGHLAQKFIDDGKINSLWIPAWLLPLIITFIGYGIPCMLCAYFGSDLVYCAGRCGERQDSDGRITYRRYASGSWYCNQPFLHLQGRGAQSGFW